MTERLLDIDQVRAIVPLARSSIYRLMAADKFPKARKVGGRSLWRESAVQAFVEQPGPEAEYRGAA